MRVCVSRFTRLKFMYWFFTIFQNLNRKFPWKTRKIGKIVWKFGTKLISDKSVSGKIQSFPIFSQNFPTFPKNFQVKKISKLCRIKFPINWHHYFLSDNGENLQKKSRKIHVKCFSWVFPTKEAFKRFATWDKVVERYELHKVAFMENCMENPEKRENHPKNFHRYD